MANYKVEVTNSARKEIKKLDKQVTSKIISKLEELENNPFPIGHKKLKNQPGYRVRVQDYRIIYDVSTTIKIVKVYKVGHRKDVYKF